MGRSISSDRPARQRPWRVRPSWPGTRRVQRTSVSMRRGPMPVRISIATRVPGGKRVGNSTATPPPLTSAVRPRKRVGLRPTTWVQRTGILTRKREWSRLSRVAEGRGPPPFLEVDFFGGWVMTVASRGVPRRDPLVSPTRCRMSVLLPPSAWHYAGGCAWLCVFHFPGKVNNPRLPSIHSPWRQENTLTSVPSATRLGPEISTALGQRRIEMQGGVSGM